MNTFKNDFTFWYPQLLTYGLPMPKSILVSSYDVKLGYLTDGKTPDNIQLFLNRLKLACDQIGYPCFLKTGQTSNKHDWKNSCFIKNKEENLLNHVANIVELSFIANIAGPPLFYDHWIVRELLPTETVCTAFYGEMPIAREVRYFFKGGKLQCHHPYWPDEAFSHQEELLPKVKKLQEFTTEELDEPNKMVGYIARLMEGYWSIDLLLDKNNKWWVIDMATGEDSYHWNNCKFNKKS